MPSRSPIGWRDRRSFSAALGDTLGFGKELGGLLAGVVLASTSFRDAIAARLAPLRDFLLLFFFVVLNAKLDLGNIGQSTIDATRVVALRADRQSADRDLDHGLAGLPCAYRLAGLTVAQISEFSLIFMAMGVAIGHVSTEALGLVTLVGLITIAASTYMITYSHELYAFCEPLRRVFRTRRAPRGHSRAFSQQAQNAMT